MPIDLLSYAPLALSALAVVLGLVLLIRLPNRDIRQQAARLEALETLQERSERTLREELARGREEAARLAQEQRRELGEVMKTLGGVILQRMTEASAAQACQLDAGAAQLAAFSKAGADQFDAFRAQSLASATALRGEIIATLTRISETMSTTMKDLAAAENVQLDAMATALGQLTTSNSARLEQVRATVEERLHCLQADNAKQLETMRQTVDEKLQGTLEKRLGESFRQVSERLEQVHKGLGEMQTLATGVGDLKKVLTNVKTRGTWGEVQLGALLEQVLSAEQYAANVATGSGGERVEFAVKLPGQDGEEPVLLPIDAKFPVEDFQRLLEAQERGDADGAELAGRQLEARVRACAKDIRDKYLRPPRTTDFGILFLPIEGLFAEVIRRPGLCEAIQRELRVVLAGPTTLWSILTSLQMGFRTLAIQKRSSEVWNLLGAVKTEWGKYGDMLDAVQKKLHQASETIEKAQVRSRAVGRQLRDVQELPVAEAGTVLPLRIVENEDG